MSDHIMTTCRDKVLTIQMNRVDKKNALTQAMYADMVSAIKQAEEDALIHAILIKGSEDCFTSGNDLWDFMQLGSISISSPVVQFLYTLSQAKKPIVAQVSGLAMGVGTTMLLHCDLVYIAEDAYFQMPFVNLGLCPESASSMILPAMMGHHKAAEIMLLGESFDAKKALEIGLGNEICSAAELTETVNEKLQKLVAQPPHALQVTKELMKKIPSHFIDEMMKREFEQFESLLHRDEAKDALAAFLNKS